MPTPQEAAAKYFNMRADVTTLALGQLGRQPDDNTPLAVWEELGLCVFSWSVSVMQLEEKKMLLLLSQLKDMLRSCGDEIADTETSRDELHFAESRYVTWLGLHKFWDTHDSRYLNPLPTPPRWRTSLHLAGLYVTYKLRRDKDDQAADNSGQAG